ncbi:MAG: hypothetical protein H7Y17_07115 [Chlorobia bacterium]|nr:hypothetical protein [Fimbriimonadaceae bacterium]
MRTLLTIAAIALACIAATQIAEKVNLTSKQAVGSVAKYKIAAKIADQFEIKGTVECKVSKIDKGAPTEIDWKCTEFVQSMDGTAGPEGPPPALLAKVDKFGLPETLDVKENGAVYVAIAIASYHPEKELGIGDTFKIDWKGKNDGGVMTGTGALKEIKTEGGLKIAVLKSNIQMTPAGQSSPADLEITSEFNLADGTLIKSTLKGTISEGDFFCTVTLVK